MGEAENVKKSRSENLSSVSLPETPARDASPKRCAETFARFRCIDAEGHAGDHMLKNPDGTTSTFRVLLRVAETREPILSCALDGDVWSAHMHAPSINASAQGKPGQPVEKPLASLVGLLLHRLADERAACRKWWDEHATEIVGDDSLTVRFDAWLRARGAS